MKQKHAHVLTATLAALALSLGLNAQSDRMPSAGSNQTGSSTSSSANSTGVTNSGGQAGQPGGSSYGQAQSSGTPSTSTEPGNSAFGQERAGERRNDPPREETPPATDPTATPKTGELSPTGTSSAAMTPNANPAAISAGTKVRTALDANADFSGYDLQVEPQGERIVLKGTVGDKSLKKEIVKAAKSAAGDVKIDDQLTVRDK